MTTHRIQRTVRMSAASLLLALVAVSFLAFGSASAHPLSRAQTGQSSTFPSAGSTCSSPTVQIKIIRFGQFSVAVFSCTTVTVKTGAVVVFVNITQYNEFVVNSDFSIFLPVPHQGSAMLPTSQPGQLQVRIYGSPSPDAHLTINVVS